MRKSQPEIPSPNPFISARCCSSSPPRNSQAHPTSSPDQETNLSPTSLCRGRHPSTPDEADWSKGKQAGGGREQPNPPTHRGGGDPSRSRRSRRPRRAGTSCRARAAPQRPREPRARAGVTNGRSRHTPPSPLPARPAQRAAAPVPTITFRPGGALPLRRREHRPLLARPPGIRSPSAPARTPPPFIEPKLEVIFKTTLSNPALPL